MRSSNSPERRPSARRSTASKSARSSDAPATPSLADPMDTARTFVPAYGRVRAKDAALTLIVCAEPCQTLTPKSAAIPARPDAYP